MNDFFKRFLMEEGDRLNPDTGRYAALATFGKHPGWDDHIEDIGLETGSLNLAKLILYEQGVGGQIDAGAWEKLKADQRLAAFNHTFVWLRGDQFLLGRMWSSSDGKGRTRYPMILCAHCIGVPLAWAMEKMLPQLEDAEKSCQAAKTADEVRAILDRSRARLRHLLDDPAAAAASRGSAAAVLNQFVAAPAFGSEREGWFRILYWLHSQARSFGVGRFRLRKGKTAVRAKQFRVPLGLLPAWAVPLWGKFFALHVDPSVPVLLVWAADQDWMDVTLGEPTSHEFFCLRAGRGALSLATEIPYDYDRRFREVAVRQLIAFQTGSEQLPAATEEQPGEQGTGRWIKNLTGKFFLLLVLGSLAALVP